MNETIETILKHRSVRQFQEKKLTREQIETIVRCAQAASTSSFVQAYTIIGVTDQSKKQQLAQVAVIKNMLLIMVTYSFSVPTFIVTT